MQNVELQTLNSFFSSRSLSLVSVSMCLCAPSHAMLTQASVHSEIVELKTETTQRQQQQILTGKTNTPSNDMRCVLLRTAFSSSQRNTRSSF